MGKAKKDQKKAARRGPTTGRPDPPPLDPATLTALRDAKILPIIRGITSSNPTDRTTYLSAFINTITDPTCRRLLLKERVVNTLLEKTIHDENPELVVLAWGALRVVGECEGYDQSLYMYRKDVVTPLRKVIENIKSTNVTSITKPQQKVLWDLTDNIVSLVICLCETTMEVTKAVGNGEMIKFLVELLRPETGAPDKVQDSAALCLHTITEENEDGITSLMSEASQLVVLLKLKDQEGAVMRVRTVAVCGILHHVLVENQLQGVSDEGTISHLDLVRILTASLNANTSTSVEQTEETKLAIQLALETIASIGTAIQDEKGDDAAAPKANGEAMEVEDEDGMDDDEDEEKLEDEEDDHELPVEMEQDMELVTGEEGTAAKVNGAHESESDSILAFLVTKTVSTILPVAQPTPNVNLLLQLRAVNALNNIAWTVVSVLESDPSTSLRHRQAWTETVNQIWNTVVTPVLVSNTADLELADALSSLSWAISKSVTGAVDLTANQHRAFISLYNAATDAELKAKCVGVIGALSLAQGRINTNKELGVFLITVIAGLPDSLNEAVIEALNAVYDVYADADFDYDAPVFVECGFLAHLKGVTGKVKAMTKRIDQRKFPELRERADEAALNLAEFIKYKTKERK